jgi:hypothetical protein
MATDFVAYIDESGDEGFKFLDRERGSSRWFVLSATVVRKSNDLNMVEVARAARALLGKPDKYVLHFRELKHEHRVPLVRLIGNAPVRTVSILVHKPSIPNPESFQHDGHKLYRYCTRLLLERVSWLCRSNASSGSGCTADLVFSNRSAMSYDELRSYLRLLKKQSESSADISVKWDAIHPDRVRAVNHDQLAGLQIADAVASSMFFAANRTQYGEVEEGYMRLLNRTVYRNKDRVEGYGLKFWCKDDAEKKRLAGLASL